MKNLNGCIRYYFFTAVCVFIFVSACSSEKPAPPPEDTSAPKKTEEQTSAADLKKPAPDSEGVITIYAELFSTHTKGPVLFTHDKHHKEYKIACNECHHIYENGKNIWTEEKKTETCDVCHNEPTVKKEKSLSPDLQKKNLKLAFHNNCRLCHRKLKAEDASIKAPTTCSGCHEKI